MDEKRQSQDDAGALARSLITGASETPPERATVDEIQIPRRKPVMTDDVRARIEKNPSLGRQWERMMKGYEEFPYQQTAPDAAQSEIKRGLLGVLRHMDDSAAGGNSVPLADKPALDTSWIHGNAPDHDRLAAPIEDARIVERSAPAPAAQATARQASVVEMFVCSTSAPGQLTIEVAWIAQGERGDRFMEQVIVLSQGDPELARSLSQFRALVEGKRVNLWDIPSFFKEIGPFLTPDFEPLHLWLDVTGFHKWALGRYSVELDDMDRVTMATFERRFGVRREAHRKAPRASQFCRIRGRVDLDVLNKKRGRAVAPLELDPEQPA